MATIGLTLTTVLLTLLAVRCNSWINRATVVGFWAAYALVAALFAGVL